jgi:hypothetical protein
MKLRYKNMATFVIANFYFYLFPFLQDNIIIMATDLPFHNSSRSETTFYGGARLGRKKRYIVFGLIAAVFFVLWFSADMSSNSVQQHSSSNEMAQDNAKDNTVLQDEVNQAKEEEDEVQDDAVIVESTTTTTKAKTAKAKAKSTTTTTTTTTAAAKTTTSSIELAKELPLIVETNHLKYFVVIASEANSFERRKLIRSSYFGMDNNVEPCMGSEKKGISYAFWLYGDAPQSKTPERRVYEAEKMEWFDLHQTTDAEFDQVKAMKWVS